MDKPNNIEREQMIERVKVFFEIGPDDYTDDMGLFADFVIQVRDEALAAREQEIAAVLDAVEAEQGEVINAACKHFGSSAGAYGFIYTAALAAIRESLSGGRGEAGNSK